MENKKNLFYTTVFDLVKPRPLLCVSFANPHNLYFE